MILYGTDAKLKKERKKNSRSSPPQSTEAAQLNEVRPKAYNLSVLLAATIRTMHDLGAQPQGGRKTGVPGEKPSESDRNGQISAHMRTPGVDPRS